METAKMDIERVMMALNGRIMGGNLETDFESLVLSISKQVEVDLEVCKKIMLQDTVAVISECMKQVKWNDI